MTHYLAHAYDTVAVPEIGRFIWEDKRGRLGPDDYVEIAVKHRAAEDEAMAQARPHPATGAAGPGHARHPVHRRAR
nr:hypothetical protein [Massilia rhizosphaerae]